MRTLKAGGANLTLCASNPLSTQDDMAASLVKDYGIPVFAINGEDNKTYYKHIHQALDIKPHITMDDGADLVSTLHTEPQRRSPGISGGTEETTTGVIRLKAMEQRQRAAVSRDRGQRLEDQTSVRQPLRHRAVDHRRYHSRHQHADCRLDRGDRRLRLVRTRGGRRAPKDMGANVIVTEVDPVKAIEAVMDGFQVMPMAKAAPIGDLFITLTGDINVIRLEHFAKMKDGAIICNSGHFNVEIDLKAIGKAASDAQGWSGRLSRSTSLAASASICWAKGA